MKLIFFIMILFISCNEHFDLDSPYTVRKDYVKDDNSCFDDNDCKGMVGDDYNCDVENGGVKCVCDLSLRACQDACNYVNCPENSECNPQTGVCECKEQGYVYDEELNSCIKNEAYLKFDFSLGKNHSCAVRSGELYCWGSNDTGKLGVGSDDNKFDEFVPKRIGSDITWLAVVNTFDFSCALKIEKIGQSNTGVYCWGLGVSEPKKISEHDYWKFIVSSDEKIYMIDNEGSLYNISYEEGNFNVKNENLNIKWKYFSASNFHFCGIDENDYLYCKGDNSYGQIGDMTTDYRDDFVKVGNEKWLTVSCDENYTCGIKLDNSLYCWGNNENGKLGIGKSEDAYKRIMSPEKVGENFVYLATAKNYTCGIKNYNGLYYCWGENKNKEFFTLDKDGRYEEICKDDICIFPIEIPLTYLSDLQTLNGIKLGRFKLSPYACIFDSNKNLYCMGYNTHGQLGTNTSNSCENAYCKDFKKVDF